MSFISSIDSGITRQSQGPPTFTVVCFFIGSLYLILFTSNIFSNSLYFSMISLLILKYMHIFYLVFILYIIASTNSFGLNISISSICSPTPMYFIGKLSSETILNTTPPFAVESSFVSIIPFKLVFS